MQCQHRCLCGWPQMEVISSVQATSVCTLEICGGGQTGPVPYCSANMHQKIEQEVCGKIHLWVNHFTSGLAGPESNVWERSFSVPIIRRLLGNKHYCGRQRIQFGGTATRWCLGSELA